jgi:hypothetical protein
MCFSATASFAASGVLLPAGVASIQRAWRTDRRYVAFCTLPLLFGIQQFLEGLVWTAGGHQNQDLVDSLSLTYMFFSWIAWPVLVPASVYFLEPNRRKPIYFMFPIAGAVLGAAQYFPYLVHPDWLVTTFLKHAISYGGVELFDLIIGRPATYAIYAVVVVIPLLIASDSNVRVFGLLIGSVLAATYFFFSFAYISVFCFGGAVMSLYIGFMIWTKPPRQSPVDHGDSKSSVQPDLS